MRPCRPNIAPRAPLLVGLTLLTGCGIPEFFDRLLSAPGGIVAPQQPRPEEIPPLTQSEAEARVVALVNQARATARTCGDKGSFAAAPPLLAESRLALAARGHSSDMAQQAYFDHVGKDGSQPWDRVSAQQYPWQSVGENIAAGYATPEEAVAGWLKSPGHCANIMAQNYTQTGVGQVQGGPYKIYWTQVFARPR
jgi:uncharacterized protein YkwD